MLIKILDYISEFFLFVLLVGITVSNAPTEVASYLLIFIFLVKRITLREIKPPSSAINIFLYMYFVVVIVTLLRSSYFDESIRGFSRIPKYIFLYFALIDFFKNNPKRMNRFFWMIMIVAVVTFINGIFQSMFGFDFFRHNAIDEPNSLRRISASFVHSNDFGTYAFSVLLLTFLMFSTFINKRKRTALLLISLLGFYCLIKTSSRGAWVGFLIGIIVYFIIYNKKIALLIPVVLLAIIMLLPHGLTRVTGLFKQEHNTVWERTKLWQGTWSMIKQHPVLGYGVNTFSKNFSQHKPVDYPDLRYAHNSYLQMWSEIGIIGLLVFLAIPLTILAKALKGIKKKIKAGPLGPVFLGAVCAYIGFLIHSGMDNHLFSLVLTTLFWVLSAYIVSLDKYLTEKINA